MSIQFIKRGGTDTSDATATAGDLINPKTAYVDGEKITGTLVENGTYQKTVTDIYDSSQESRVYYRRNNLNPGVAIKTGNSIRLYSSYSTLANAIALTADKIKKDVTIIGVTGTYEGGGGTSFPPDWSLIGYGNTPQSIINDFNYSKNIYDNWDNTETDLHEKFYQDKDLTYMPLVNTSNATTINDMFNGCSNLKDIPLLNISNVTTMNNMFLSCSNIVSIPLFNTSNVTAMGSAFSGCSNLKDVPLLNTSKVSSMNYTFRNCTSLTNESLNNILAMCTNSAVTTNKTLARIGLSSAQATICTTLSNYQAFLNAGWTTGY